MKILFLNLQLDAEHELLDLLTQSGGSLLLPENFEEAWTLLELHGKSVDLAVIHREGENGQGEPGIDFVRKIKTSESQADLPLILTTSKLTPAECAVHQETNEGANAYLPFPYEGTALIELIEAVTGNALVPDLSLSSSSEVLLTSVTKTEEIEMSEEVEPYVEPTEAKQSTVDELDELPYLSSNRRAGAERRSELLFSVGDLPIGDAIVPGGAANTPDAETLKKYLLLREQDVIALSQNLKTAQDQYKECEQALKMERARSSELTHLVEEQKESISKSDQEKAKVTEAFSREMEEIQFQLKQNRDKTRHIEGQLKQASDEMERLKERVRQDVRKIRLREKELESKLEISKKDNEAMLGARESKIIELKRKLDLTEFNLDLLQEKLAKEKENNFRLRESLTRAAQAMRVAGGVLEEVKDRSTLPYGSNTVPIEEKKAV